MREHENLSIVIGQYIIFYTTAQKLPHSKRFRTQHTSACIIAEELDTQCEDRHDLVETCTSKLTLNLTF